jgi:hypothetical protein
MKLPIDVRESLVEGLDDFLEAFATSPDAEAVAAFVVEQLEAFADDAGIDDIIAGLEESGGIETTLLETLEGELSSNDELEFTGEEVVSLLEKACDIEWEDDLSEELEDDDLEDDDDEDEEEDEDEED